MFLNGKDHLVNVFCRCENVKNAKGQKGAVSTLKNLKGLKLMLLSFKKPAPTAN
jgi:hypothetical protein